MTRKEAIKRLKEIDIRGALQEDYDALHMAIEALRQEPCEDCISRKEVIDAIHKQMFKFVDKAIDEQSEETDDKVDLLLTVNKEITGAIKKLPLAKTERKVGHWIENAPEWQNVDPPYICSECGLMHLRKTNYCDQCGAKMAESEE